VGAEEVRCRGVMAKYEGTKAAVRTHGEDSENFPVKVGLHQVQYWM
jgi:hypothetical protein